MTAVYDDILLPTDGGVAADAGASHGIELAAAVDARIHALYIAHLHGEGSDLDNADELDDRYRDYGHQVTGELCETASDRGIGCITAIRSGEPHEAIVEYAEANDIDLIVMGSAPRGEVGAVGGSTAEKVVRSSPIPVTTVRSSH